MAPGAGPAVVVVGSANLDVVLRVERIPAPGETVLALDRQEHVGGKGLNQAVAAARAGAPTHLIGAVGDDEAARSLVAAMAAEGIGTSGLRRLTGPSGTALVVVQASGENSIVVAAGANGAAEALQPQQRGLIARAAVVLCQLEVPLPLVADAVACGRRSGARVVLNAAPAQALPADLLDGVDVLVVNEHEALTLTGHRAAGPSGGGTDGAAVARAAEALAGTGVEVVVTLGAAGALHASPVRRLSHVDGIPAEAVDTTGAGDAFTGFLVAHLAAGGSTLDGLRHAVAAGSLAVRRHGAVPSLPGRAEVDRLLAGQG